MEIIKNFIINLSPIVAILSPIIAWFITKRHYQTRDLKKQDVGISSDHSSLMSKNLELYQKMLDDIEFRYEEKIKKRDLEIQLLEKELDILKRQRLEERIEFEKEIDDLRDKIKNLQ